MAITVLTGLPGSGKSTTLIQKVNASRASGRRVDSFACSDSPIMRSRPNLLNGRSGSRTPGVIMELTHFVGESECAALLAELPAGTLAAFDEAQYFGASIVPHWIAAAARGVEVLVASPSGPQLAELRREGIEPTHLESTCVLCLHPKAAVAVRLPQSDGTLTLCDRCLTAVSGSVRAEVLDRALNQPPDAGTRLLYQPIELEETKGWTVIREDSERRAAILGDAARRALAGLPTNGPMPTYLDLGCNSGYLCHLMRRQGFQATGVDVADNDLILARLMDSYFRRDGTLFIKSDAYTYLEETRHEPVDVSSAFSVLQWVMIQKSPEHGIQCIEWLFEKTRAVCVLELGDSSEAHYRERIGIDIGTEWTRQIMADRGGFDEIEVYEAAEHGLKRDLVIGLRMSAQPSAAETDQTLATAG